MDPRIREAIVKYEDYQRLQKEISLEFVIECMTNPKRGNPTKLYGEVLRQHMGNPSLWVVGSHYHELVEFELLRKMGYSDEMLGDNKTKDPNHVGVHIPSKRKELEFYQEMGQIVLEGRPRSPFLGLVFAGVAAAADYQIPPPSPERVFTDLPRRIAEGMVEYGLPFSVEDVEQGIALFKLGGDKCSGEQVALTLARDYLSGRPPASHWELL